MTGLSTRASSASARSLPTGLPQMLLIGAAVAGGWLAVGGPSAGAPEQAAGHLFGVGPEGLQVLAVEPASAPRVVGGLTSLGAGVDVALAPTGAYAYFARAEGWAVVDVGDPETPKPVNDVPIADGEITAIAAMESLLLVARSDPRSGVGAIDVYTTDDPSQPLFRSTVDVGAQILSFDAGRGALYVATGQNLQFYDLGTLERPELVGRLPRAAVDIAIDGDRAYVLELGAVAVLDVRDPLKPRELGAGRLPFSTARWIAPLQDSDCFTECGRAIVGAELSPEGGGGGIVVVEATDPANPVSLQPTSAGIGVTDIASAGAVIHVANGAAYLSFSFKLGSTPERLGSLAARIDRFDLSLPVQQPTPTATVDRRTATASPTGTETPRQPTTETRPPPTGTETATATEAPSRTPPAGRTWEQHASGEGPVDLGRVRVVRPGPGDRTWLKIRPIGTGPDRVVESDGRRLRIYDSIRIAVTLRYSAIVAYGSVRDLWSVDEAGHVWVGPEYYDGVRWRTLAVDEVQPGGGLTHDERALVDADGLAWVPYRGTVGCPDPQGCTTFGLRVFGTESMERALPIDVVPDAGTFGVEPVHLVIGRTPTTLFASGADQPAANQGHSADSLHQGNETDWIVAHREMLVLPGGASVAYPLLDPGEQTQNAGYATAATRRPDGRLQVFTWIEDHSGRPTLTWRLLANTWTGSEWEVWDLTPETPLVHDDNQEYLRISAAAYDESGKLWVGSSQGEVATWFAGEWLEHFTPDNSPLLPDRPITDIYASPGTTWIVQPGALFTYGSAGALTPVVSLFAPNTETDE